MSSCRVGCSLMYKALLLSFSHGALFFPYRANICGSRHRGGNDLHLDIETERKSAYLRIGGF